VGPNPNAAVGGFRGVYEFVHVVPACRLAFGASTEHAISFCLIQCALLVPPLNLNPSSNGREALFALGHGHEPNCERVKRSWRGELFLTLAWT